MNECDGEEDTATDDVTVVRADATSRRHRTTQTTSEDGLSTQPIQCNDPSPTFPTSTLQTQDSYFTFVSQEGDELKSILKCTFSIRNLLLSYTEIRFRVYSLKIITNTKIKKS